MYPFLISTVVGRARAWLRLALMQKKLADYFKVLVEQRDGILKDFYEPMALMMSDEAAILGGLLVGLNVIDCNFCLKVITRLLKFREWKIYTQVNFFPIGRGSGLSARSD